MSKAEFKVKCPHCKKIFSYYFSEFRPFCSERCKMVDLGHWLEESYRIPEKNLIQDESEDEVDIKSDKLEE